MKKNVTIKKIRGGMYEVYGESGKKLAALRKSGRVWVEDARPIGLMAPLTYKTVKAWRESWLGKETEV